MNIRLNKFLADAGICSRRKADECILIGDVTINGIDIRSLGTKIDPDKDIVTFQGNAVKLDNKHVYFALNKPKGIISSASDDKGRKTVLDFVPKTPRVYPIGRLDENSEGLMILTNDGVLTQKLTHPSFEHKKTYEIIAKIVNNELKNTANAEKRIKKMMESGIRIDGKLMRADEVIAIPLNEFKLTITLVLHTGFNHQIRRMCSKVGLEVLKLVRTKIGDLSLADLDLKSGECREITLDQIL